MAQRMPELDEQSRMCMCSRRLFLKLDHRPGSFKKAFLMNSSWLDQARQACGEPRRRSMVAERPVVNAVVCMMCV